MRDRGDHVMQAAHSENAETRHKSYILAIITIIVVIYAAAPTYGIIRDLSSGEHVFVLNSDSPGVTMKRPVLEFFDQIHHLFSPQQDVAVPVGQFTDLKGPGNVPGETPGQSASTGVDNPPGPPENPDTSPVPPPGGGSGNGNGGSDGGGPSPFAFDVIDDATAASYGTAGAVSVNIFGANKRIAPGMSGTYRFTVDNTGNRHSTFYDVSFIATDTLPGAYKIPMRFRLRADGGYVAGSATAWCTPAQLYQDTIVAGGRDVEYTLEWNWPEGANDNEYAAFAGNEDYFYTITIKVTAQAQ